MLNRISEMALGAAIVLAVGVSSGPAWCGEVATEQKQYLALLKTIDANLVENPDDLVLTLQHAQLMGLLKRYDDQIAEANKLIEKIPNLKDAYL